MTKAALADARCDIPTNVPSATKLPFRGAVQCAEYENVPFAGIVTLVNAAMKSLSALHVHTDAPVDASETLKSYC